MRPVVFCLLALAALTAYLAWRVGPLVTRMDALELDRLTLRDEVFSEIEKLQSKVTQLRPPTQPDAASAVTPAPVGETPRKAPTAQPTPQAPNAPVPEAPHAREAGLQTELSNYAHRRLLPEDAALADMVVAGLPPAEIASKLEHSEQFVIVKIVKLEERLAAAPDAPRELVEALRLFVERARKKR
jgi:hypothetical protein